MKADAVYCGDCQRVLGNTVEFPDSCVDLIYVDPPFFSNRKYELLWNDGYELRAFEDRWKGGVENYVAWMEPKLRECHRVLKPTGTMYLHCDWHANAHLRIIMDRIFGSNRFLNEIIWHYRSGAGTPRRFGRKHDTILFYSKSGEYTFNADDLREPYAESTIQRLKYAGARERNVKKVLDRGGRLPDDVWPIEHVQGNSRERRGYPTQKPEALLDRIIRASSSPGDVVLDPMCGCGTAIAVARKLGRRWVGVDVSPTACKEMTERMRELGAAVTEADIVGLPKTYEQIVALQPFEFQNWVIQHIGGRISPTLSGDKGVDGRLADGTPLQVKQSWRVGRKVVDEFVAAIQRERRSKGVIVALSFGRGAFEEVARLRNEGGVEIALRTLKQLMEEG